MNVDHLVTMANEIGAFFTAEAGGEGAPREIAQHMTKFWEQRMRAQIIAHVRDADGAGLSPAARAAVLLLKPVAAPATGPA